MVLVRAVLFAGVVMLCAGFVPVSGCAKGCGKLASHGGDDLARTGARYGDDLARGGGRYGDDLARGGSRVGGPPVVNPGAAVGDDIALLTTRGLDDTLAHLPEVEGSVSAIARTPTSGDLVLGGLDDSGRTFGKDYARSLDDLAVTEKQHDKLMDAFETAQDLAQDALEAVTGGEDDDTAAPPGATAAARQRIQLVGLELEASLATILSPEQLASLRTRLGSAELIAYRLGKERPIRKGTPTHAGSGAKRPSSTGAGRRATGSAGSDKVTP